MKNYYYAAIFLMKHKKHKEHRNMAILGTPPFLFACSYLKRHCTSDIHFYVDLDILTEHTLSEENISIVLHSKEYSTQ